MNFEKNNPVTFSKALEEASPFLKKKESSWLGKKIYLSFNENEGWKIKQLGIIDRILRSLNLAYRDTHLNLVVKALDKLTVNDAIKIPESGLLDRTPLLREKLMAIVKLRLHSADNPIAQIVSAQINPTEKEKKTVDLINHNPTIVFNPNAPITQIKVLDQTTLNGGNETCGYHAWKNAIISLALAQSAPPQEELINLFNDPHFYADEVEKFLKNFDTQGGDIALTSLTEAIDKLFNQEIDAEKYPILHHLATLLISSRENISFLNTAIEGQLQNPFVQEMGIWDKSAINGGNTHLTLDNLANTIKALKRPGPFTHAFVSGTGGHWVTLIMQKDVNNQIKWYGTDSWHNQKQAVPNHQSIIQKLVQDPNFAHQTIINEYDQVNINIEKLSKNLNNEGHPIHNLKTNDLAGSYDQVLLGIDEIKKCTIFLKDLNLYKDEKFSKYVLELKKVTAFYQNYLDQLPDVENQEAVNAFFSTYLPYKIFDPEHFANNEIVSPLVSSIPALKTISSMTIDDLSPLENQIEKFSKSDAFSIEAYGLVIEKFFDRHGIQLKSLLIEKKLLPKSFLKANNNLIINHLKCNIDLDQMNDIKNAINDFNLNKLMQFANKYDIISKFDRLPKNLKKALVVLKKKTLEKNKSKLDGVILYDKEVIIKELISKKKQLIDQLVTLD